MPKVTLEGKYPTEVGFEHGHSDFKEVSILLHCNVTEKRVQGHQILEGHHTLVWLLTGRRGES